MPGTQLPWLHIWTSNFKLPTIVLHNGMYMDNVKAGGKEREQQTLMAVARRRKGPRKLKGS